MLDSLEQFVSDFAGALKLVDAHHPVALSARTGAPYQPGIGPHAESATINLVMDYLQREHSTCYPAVSREIPYRENTRQKCDICFGKGPNWDWCIEVKMLRLMGDNGKPTESRII